MEKMSIIAIICAFHFLTIISFGATVPLDPCQGQYKVARLQVYVHDLFANYPNATVWPVARGDRINESSTFFSEVRVMDNKMTTGIEYDSATVGRLQGMISFVDLEEIAVMMSTSLYFNAGQFNGSSLILLGRNPMTQAFNRTLPIVGGTGTFLNARGYTISNSVVQRSDSGVIEYNIYVAYEDGMPDPLERFGATKDVPLTQLF